MGRNAGEDYEEQIPCIPGKHDFAVNGTCWGCRRTRMELVNGAIKTILLHGAVEQKNVAEKIPLLKDNYGI